MTTEHSELVYIKDRVVLLSINFIDNENYHFPNKVGYTLQAEFISSWTVNDGVISNHILHTPIDGFEELLLEVKVVSDKNLLRAITELNKRKEAYIIRLYEIVKTQTLQYI